MKDRKIDIAVDIGSACIKAAALDERRQITRRVRYPVRGRPGECLKTLLRDLVSEVDSNRCFITGMTGSGSALYAELFGLKPVNNILAAYRGAVRLVPHAGAVLEIGGEHANFIRLSPQENGEKILEDFHTNSMCSAGTGSYLEQEAHRLNLSIENFSQLAFQSSHFARIAGRCAVFTKTDIVHLHQNGVPLPDIAYSLCRAIARNIFDELVCGRAFDAPLVVIGGVAANKGIIRALKEILNLDDSSLIVPEDHLFAAAVGSIVSSNSRECRLHDALERLERPPRSKPEGTRFLKPLQSVLPDPSPAKTHSSSPGDSFIGIDIGSTSTNLVCIDPDGEIIDDVTLPTRGQALRAVYRGLSVFRDRYGAFTPGAVGITGSGRKFAGEIIGADAVLNEITAHALGAVHLYPRVDTIFDIGGQDSKFIRIENGSVVNFEMNKVCAAGTGSFLEETSELLGLDIIDEFAREAGRSKNPVDLGERCTVFMMSELVQKLREGYSREDLAAGLCYSVVKNYLSKIVGRHKTGTYISFQGGVAGNRAIVSALENFLQTTVYVHKYHDIAGALGAALFAKKQAGETGVSRFRGFENLDIDAVKTRSFECKSCANNCMIHFTRNESGDRFFSGGLCDKYEEQHLPRGQGEKGTGKNDLFALRDTALDKNIKQWDDSGKSSCIGVPRGLVFYDLIPFWSTFFNTLEIPYKFSEPTSKKTIQKGVSICPSNPCLPVKIAYGHCRELLDEGIGKIFIPCVSNLSFLTKEERLNHICPAAQAWPFTARSLFPRTVTFLTPTIRFAIPHLLKSDILRFGKSLGCYREDTLRAFKNALEAQETFYTSVEERGKALFSNPREDKTYIVVISRSYIMFDPQIGTRLKKIFKELDVIAIPMDMVPVQPESSDLLDGMYWYYGKRFLQAADAVFRHKNIAVIHLSTFGCGADSFIVHFLREKLTGVPLLELEIDEHNEFTGIGTRVEAFVHSLQRSRSFEAKAPSTAREISKETLKEKKLLIPRMSDHAFAVSAAFGAYGVDAEVLPLPDEESMALGKQSVAGQECLPCPLVTGDMLKYLKYHGDESHRAAFFMISGDGPCRLGQYPYLQRLTLDKNGFGHVPIFNAGQDQNFYEQFGIVPASFKRKAWQGVVAADLLLRKWRETRPYVEDRESIDAIYYEELENLCGCLRKNGKLSIHLKKAVHRLENIKKSSPGSRPVIAVLGENYVRCNSFANGKIAESLEDLGAEVWFPSLFEWVYYTNWTARLHCLYEKQYGKYLKLFLINAVQHWDTSKLIAAVKGQLRNLYEPSVNRIFQMASGYIPRTFEGETVIETARTIDFFKKNVNGVIHVVPFGCIMGTIVETLSTRLSQNLNGFPVMTLQYEGQDYKLPAGKLEGFMLRARLWEKKRRKNENLNNY